MNTLKISAKKNETLDICKMVAAFFVVCIHVCFPGAFGRMILCIGRFAVPLFFAVSGYFSYGISSGKAVKRCVRLLKINAICIGLCFLWTLFETRYVGTSTLERWLGMIPSIKALVDWMFLHLNPFGSHLWYLTAIVVCYGVLAIYVRFFGSEQVEYRPFYLVGVFLFIVQFAVGDLLRLFIDNIPYYLFRNGWFIGLPMFILGIFLREYQDRMIENYHLSSVTLLLLFLSGSALSALQWERFGPRELPVGAIVQVIAIILFAQLHPTVARKSRSVRQMVASLGFLSLFTYIAHLYIANLYAMFLVHPIIDIVGWQAESWMRPLLVFGLTIAAGILLYWLYFLVRRLLRKPKHD